MARSVILKIDTTSFFSAEGGAIWIKLSKTGTEWHVDCGDVWKWKPDVKFQYGGRLGEFNCMSSQSYVSHCRVLPLGEFTVTIPEPHATLQGVRILSAILKIVSPYFILFLFLMQFRLWRARLSYRLRYTCFYWKWYHWQAYLLFLNVNLSPYNCT